MVTWPGLVLAYAAYLTLVAWVARGFTRARWPALAGLAAAAALWTAWPAPGAATASWAIAARVLVPGAVLLGAYLLSGRFFVTPSPAWEARLLRMDQAALHDTGLLRAYHAAPVLVRELFELAYLLVYPVLPAGALVLVLADRTGDLDRYWVTVFAAELACYGFLPWIQTRPPRAIAHDPVAAFRAGPIRRLNLTLLRRGSIQVNTFPSGHAAGAFAVAVAAGSSVPAASLPLLVLAGAIMLATIVGRYHYAADSVLGVALGVGAGILTR